MDEDDRKGAVCHWPDASEFERPSRQVPGFKRFGLARSEIDVTALYPSFGLLVPGVDVAQFLIIHTFEITTVPAVHDDRCKKIILERLQRTFLRLREIAGQCGEKA